MRQRIRINRESERSDAYHDLSLFGSLLLTATAYALHKHISINKLIDDLSTQALSEFDSEIRFRALASQGNRERGIKLLDKLDASFSGG
jgi:hypothetical protein